MNGTTVSQTGQLAARDRHVFVTGGGSGIGLSIARTFAQAGHAVTVAGRDRSKLEATGFNHVVLDVTDAAAVRDTLSRMPDIDIFIANAGSAGTAPALRTSDELWDRMLAANLTSVFLCARSAIPPMIERGWGRFIAVASTASVKGYAYTGAYAAAKHGVLGWIRSLAIEIAQTGVTANALCPGFADTPLVDAALHNIVTKTGRTREDALSSFVSSNPMGRLILPEEVAGAALWLASGAAASVNGQAVLIDGGEVIA